MDDGSNPRGLTKPSSPRRDCIMREGANVATGTGESLSDYD